MARRTSLEEDQVKKLLDLHGMGYSDIDIAERLGVSRYVVMRYRKTAGLPANRARGDRGLGKPKDNESYYLYTQRVLKNHLIADAMRKAIAKLLHLGRITFESAFVAMGMEPARLIHPQLPRFAQDPEKMTFPAGEKIARVEQYIERSGLAGVPGPGIMELAKVVKTNDEKAKEYWAEQAVLESGLVTATATVSMIDNCVVLPTPVQRFIEKWRQEIEQVREFTRNRMPVKKIARGFTRIREYISSRTGKKGRQGGTINIAERAAWAGAAGY